MAAKEPGLDTEEAPWQKMVKVFGSRTATEHAAHLLPYLKPHFRILDVGCGVGSITLDLANLVPDGEVLGIDTNQSTTDMAKQMAQDRGVSNVKFSVGDAHDLSAFSDESFDVVHAHQVMLHLPDPVKALTEMRRVLKTGGVLSLRDNIDLYHYPHDLWIQQNQGMWNTNDRKTGAEPQGGLYIHDWTNRAGFPWGHIQESPTTWTVTTLEQRRFFASGAKTGFRALGLKAGYGIEQDFDEIERRWVAWAEKDAGRMMFVDATVIAFK
ncbi:hypothetical protein LTR09_010990 [Extremus antarcticus]|uniref:Methyltransferase domain-containing protein n=1 Tax=Extremus antarcticus TaxID=702011 RepID=A0AAJ0GAQ8_9PEZI|nr:hypothetical protein LTR09_010990 [Extremus antarcticus]